MDLKQLRSFIAVANTLSFGSAARQLYLSQSALSIQIQNLEKHLGVPLFTRNRRSVRLTAAGEAVLADSKELLQRIADIELRAAKIGSGEVGHLRIGFVASATAQVIPSIVLAFRKLYPGVELELKNMPTVQQIETLKTGSIDVGFVRLPVSVDGLSIDSIHREPFAMVLSRAHPLAAARTITVRQLAEEPFIAYGRRWAPSFYDHWVAICRRAGFSPNVVQEVAEMDTALVLVAAGIGVAILPEGIARRSRSGVKVEPLTRERSISEIGVAVQKSRTTPLLEHFVKVSKQVGVR